MFSKRVGNTVRKGKIALYKQFLLLPQCFFERLVLQTHKNQGLFGKGLGLLSAAIQSYHSNTLKFLVFSGSQWDMYLDRAMQCFALCHSHEQEGHDGPVSLHWLIHEIPSYQT